MRSVCCTRMRLVYPYCVFKAKINYKNIAQGKTWTSGPLFWGEDGYFYILEKQQDEGYAMRYIHTSPVYLGTNFLSGKRDMIYEGDIISLTVFDKTSNTGFESPEDIIKRIHGTEEPDTERKVYDAVPLNKRIISRLSGIVCFYNSAAYLQYMNYNDGTLCYAPLYTYFEQDMLPMENVVAEVLGNVSDDPELVEDIFSTQLKTGYTHSNT